MAPAVRVTVATKSWPGNSRMRTFAVYALVDGHGVGLRDVNVDEEGIGLRDVIDAGAGGAAACGDEGAEIEIAEGDAAIEWGGDLVEAEFAAGGG